MPELIARLADRHVVVFVLGSLVFWTLLWPLALVWLGLWLLDRHRSRDASPAAVRERRVARMLRWYPADWRARYGDEMAGLLHDTMAAGGDGPRLRADVAREAVAVRLAPPGRRQALAAVCLTTCWLPLVPQGLVAGLLDVVGTPTRSWFLALHLPEAYQWPTIAAMVALGLALLGTGLALVRPPAPPRSVETP